MVGISVNQYWDLEFCLRLIIYILIRVNRPRLLILALILLVLDHEYVENIHKGKIQVPCGIQTWFQGR